MKLFRKRITPMSEPVARYVICRTANKFSDNCKSSFALVTISNLCKLPIYRNLDKHPSNDNSLK